MHPVVKNFVRKTVSVCGTDIALHATEIEGIEILREGFSHLLEPVDANSYRCRVPEFLLLCDHRLAYLSYIFQSEGFEPEHTFDFFGSLFAEAANPTTKDILKEIDCTLTDRAASVRFIFCLTVEEILRDLDERKRIQP